MEEVIRFYKCKPLGTNGAIPSQTDEFTKFSPEQIYREEELLKHFDRKHLADFFDEVEDGPPNCDHIANVAELKSALNDCRNWITSSQVAQQLESSQPDDYAAVLRDCLSRLYEFAVAEGIRNRPLTISDELSKASALGLLDQLERNIAAQQ